MNRFFLTYLYFTLFLTQSIDSDELYAIYKLRHNDNNDNI